jgi:hypothetical protein
MLASYLQKSSALFGQIAERESGTFLRIVFQVIQPL